MSMFSTHSSKPAPLADRLLERIEVDDDQIDRGDAVRRHRLLVLRVAADGEDAAVDARLQRLHPPVHDLREAGVFGHLDHRHAGRFQRLGRAAGREDLDALARPGTGRTRSRPVLSETEISARRIGKSMGSSSLLGDARAGHPPCRGGIAFAAAGVQQRMRGLPGAFRPAHSGRRVQAGLIGMAFSLFAACGAFGRLTVSTPFFIVASILSWSTLSGSRKARWNEP